MTEILPPHDSALEEVILGACLAETAAMPLVIDKLRPEMFYEEKHCEIYSALQAMFRTGKAIDIITVKDELASRGKLDFVGGPFYVANLTMHVVSSAHLEEHALILMQKFLHRETILGLYRLLPQAADETIDIDDTITELRRLLDYLDGQGSHANYLRDINRLMQDTLEQMNARIANNKNGVTGIPTGLTDLDLLTAGWQPGDLNIIAARPSVGKTAFALHLAISAAASGAPVVIYSLEMQGERLGDRLLCGCGPAIGASHLRTGQLNENEQQQAYDAARYLSGLPICVDDSSIMGMDHIRASARLLKGKGKCGCIIIDYLQLCDMKTD